MTTMPALPAQGTTNWYGWAQAVHSNAVNLSTLTTDGQTVTSTTVTASNHMVTPWIQVDSALQLYKGTADVSPVDSNHAALYQRTDGGLYLNGSAGRRRATMQWGTGTTFPTSGVLVGDTYQHTGLGCLMRWDGTVWRQVGRTEVNSTAARDTIATNYGGSGGLLYYGFTVFDTSTNLTWIYNNSGWTFPQSTPIYIQTTQPVGAPDGSLWFKI